MLLNYIFFLQRNAGTSPKNNGTGANYDDEAILFFSILNKLHRKRARNMVAMDLK